MPQDYIATAKTTIHAPVSKVWRALTDPDQIKQFMFGSDVVTNWQVGSPILYRGVWQGKPFEDKGQIVAVEPEKRLVVTHWSPLSDVPDTPENYHTVTYQLSPVSGGTEIALSQDKNATAEERDHSAGNWQMMLDSLKNLLEQ